METPALAGLTRPNDVRRLIRQLQAIPDDDTKGGDVPGYNPPHPNLTYYGPESLITFLNDNLERLETFSCACGRPRTSAAPSPEVPRLSLNSKSPIKTLKPTSSNGKDAATDNQSGSDYNVFGSLEDKILDSGVLRDEDPEKLAMTLPLYLLKSYGVERIRGALFDLFQRDFSDSHVKDLDTWTFCERDKFKQSQAPSRSPPHDRTEFHSPAVYSMQAERRTGYSDDSGSGIDSANDHFEDYGDIERMLFSESDDEEEFRLALEESRRSIRHGLRRNRAANLEAGEASSSRFHNRSRSRKHEQVRDYSIASIDERIVGQRRQLSAHRDSNVSDFEDSNEQSRNKNIEKPIRNRGIQELGRRSSEFAGRSDVKRRFGRESSNRFHLDEKNSSRLSKENTESMDQDEVLLVRSKGKARARDQAKPTASKRESNEFYPRLWGRHPNIVQRDHQTSNIGGEGSVPTRSSAYLRSLSPTSQRLAWKEERRSQPSKWHSFLGAFDALSDFRVKPLNYDSLPVQLDYKKFISNIDELNDDDSGSGQKKPPAMPVPSSSNPIPAQWYDDNTMSLPPCLHKNLACFGKGKLLHRKSASLFVYLF